MAKFEASVVIHKPIEDVFAFVADLSNAPRWQNGVVEAGLTSDGPMGVGSTFKYVAQVFGAQLDTRGEVTEYDPPRRYGWKSTSGPFPMHGATALEPADGGTRVTDMIEAEASGFFKLAEGVLLASQHKQMVADMAKLKALLEGAG